MQPAADLPVMFIASAAAGLGSALAATAAAYIWHRIRKDAKKCEDAMGLIEASIKRRLYHTDGTPIYITFAEFERRQKTCQEHICAEIQELKKELSQMDKKREAARDAADERYMRLIEFVGRVEQFMRNNNT